MTGQETHLRSAETETGSRSLGFHARDSATFAEFRKHVGLSRLRHEESGLPGRAAALLQLFETDPREFRANLVLMGNRECKYLEIPILTHVDVEQITEAVGRASPTMLDNLNRAVVERYKSSVFTEKLFREQGWLRTVSARLASLAEGRPRKISGVVIGTIAKNMSKAAEDLAKLEALRAQEAAARMAALIS